MFDTGCYNSWVGPDWLQQGTQSRTSKSQSHHNNGRDCPIGFISRFNSIGIYKTLFFENRNNEGVKFIQKMKETFCRLKTFGSVSSKGGYFQMRYLASLALDSILNLRVSA